MSQLPRKNGRLDINIRLLCKHIGYRKIYASDHLEFGFLLNCKFKTKTCKRQPSLAQCMTVQDLTRMKNCHIILECLPTEYTKSIETSPANAIILR